MSYTLAELRFTEPDKCKSNLLGMLCDGALHEVSVDADGKVNLQVVVTMSILCTVLSGYDKQLSRIRR